LAGELAKRIAEAGQIHPERLLRIAKELKEELKIRQSFKYSKK